MKLLITEKTADRLPINRTSEMLSAVFLISLFISTAAGAVADQTPSTDPVAEIPVGAHLEGGDMIVWDTPPDGAAPAGNFWPSGTVPYIFSSNVNSTNRTRMTDAMQLWGNVANVNFRPFQSGDTNWLFIQSASNNSSFVGPQSGSQNVNIASWTSQAIIAHELGHALGDRHEQSRTDRNSFVTINFANISSTCGSNGTSDCTSNFNIDNNTGIWLYSPYDYDSVMHYSPTAFTTGGNTINTDALFDAQNISFVNQDIGPNGQCFTNSVPAGTWQAGIGQRTHLSHWDCRMMSFIYPENNWRFVLPSRSGLFQFGTFSNPWDSFAEALATPSGGTVWIDGGSYNAVDINQSITILAPKGTVTID
ncbi:MAG: Dot/Icm T4SS effector LegP [Gammaproteobacteria bacterium]|nr:MAG: Dot/Icm T4SS effector LegP [Gammaproteobacteria bacterium]